MDIFCWGRLLRQVQTCESRDIHILGIIYYITVNVLSLLLKKRKKIHVFSFTTNWTRKILSRGVWYLLPDLDSGWASEGIVFLVQLKFSSLDIAAFQFIASFYLLVCYFVSRGVCTVSRSWLDELVKDMGCSRRGLSWRVAGYSRCGVSRRVGVDFRRGVSWRGIVL